MHVTSNGLREKATYDVGLFEIDQARRPQNEEDVKRMRDHLSQHHPCEHARDFPCVDRRTAAALFIAL